VTFLCLSNNQPHGSFPTMPYTLNSKADYLKYLYAFRIGLSFAFMNDSAGKPLSNYRLWLAPNDRKP
jgi:hypothetical protein